MRIALYQGKSRMSWAIRWQTRGKYSHAAFLLDDGNVIEAWTHGVREVQPYLHYHPDPYISTVRSRALFTAKYSALSIQHTPGTAVDIFSFREPLSRDENRSLEALARQDAMKHVPYDYFGILCFLTREKDPERGKLFCSEQVFSRCAKVGRVLLQNTAAWECPPHWIARSNLFYPEPERIVTV